MFWQPNSIALVFIIVAKLSTFPDINSAKTFAASFDDFTNSAYSKSSIVNSSIVSLFILIQLVNIIFIKERKIYLRLLVFNYYKLLE